MQSFQKFLIEYKKHGYVHTSVSDSRQLVDALLKNDKAFLRNFIVTQQGLIGVMSHDTVRNAQKVVVTLIGSCVSLCSIYDVDQEAACTIGDYYNQASDQVEDIDSLYQMATSVLLDFGDFFEQHLNKKHSKNVRRALRYIQLNVMEKILVADMFKELKLPYDFSDVFHREVGVSLKPYIQIAKLKEAKNLMSYSGMSYTDIAVHLGFSDLSHFTKICKRYTGLTAKELDGTDDPVFTP